MMGDKSNFHQTLHRVWGSAQSADKTFVALNTPLMFYDGQLRCSGDDFHDLLFLNAVMPQQASKLFLFFPSEFTDVVNKTCTMLQL